MEGLLSTGPTLSSFYNEPSILGSKNPQLTHLSNGVGGYLKRKENIFFYTDILGANNFRLVLGDCFVNAMIFIKKNTSM